MRNLVVIPARAGSKGILAKNKKILGNKSLIEWSIDFALKSFKNIPILISSDDKDIIQIGERNGQQVRNRPKELCEDNSMMHHVLKDALNFYERKNQEVVDNLILLQPTFPFRTNDEAIQLLKMIETIEFENIISVVQIEDNHPGRMYKIENEILKPFQPNNVTLNRQSLEKLYLRNGAYYVFKRNIIVSPFMYGEKIIPFLMSNEKKINIDQPIDFLIAELLYEKFYKY